MWTCRICDAEVEDDNWDTCWKCISPRDLPDAEVARRRARLERAQQCLRCEAQLEYVGTRNFHHGAAPMQFLPGSLGRLFVGHETFDVYYCPVCGKVELYLDGVGDTLRGETAAD